MKRGPLPVPALVLSACLSAGAVCYAQSVPWVAYYSDDAPPEAFSAYRIVVLDSHSHPLLAPLSDRGKTLLGYLSLGEVEEHRPY